MRTGAAAGTLGNFHEAAFYGSDDEFLAVVVPFVVDGIDAREPTIVACDDHYRQLLHDAVGSDAVLNIPRNDSHGRPAATLASYQRLVRDLVGDGAQQIRIIGDMAYPGTANRWNDQWAQLEAVVNEVFGTSPVWTLCPYDTRTTAETVLAEVLSTHQHIATADGHHLPNPAFLDPRVFLRTRARYQHPDDGPPNFEMDDPSPAQARQALARLCEFSPLTADRRHDLITAVSEVITNAVKHGCPPVHLRAWLLDTHCVVRVTDQGSGPADPFVGLVPVDHADGGEGGFGLWITNQLCEVDTLHDDDGYTVHLAVAYGADVAHA